MPPVLSKDKVTARLSYDPETGSFVWKTNRIRSRIGQPTGANNYGYIQILLDGHLYRAHRLAWLIMTGTWPDHEIDHANMDRSDNRWSNLRRANKSQNAANTGRRSDNMSGFKGVCWDKDRNKWRADIRTPEKRKHLGLFDNPVEAHRAYAKAAVETYGEYGRAA